MATTFTSTKLLVVEGMEEQRFVSALLNRAGKADIQVLPSGGKNNLRNEFRAIVRTQGFDQIEWLGVAQDADLNAASAFQRVRDVLTDNGLTAPAQSWQLQSGNPDTIIFIWPDGNRPGDVEELVWDAVVQTVSGVACIDAYFRCLDNAQPSSKARVHAYLASLSRPALRLGEAAQAGHLPLSSAAFNRFRSLLP